MSSHIHIAILDDYQGVALELADWSNMQSKASIDVYRDTIHDEDQLAKRLEPYTIYITTTGFVNRSIDMVAAAAKGIIVTGTGGYGDPTLEHIWALFFEVARSIAVEDKNVKNANPQWQTLIPIGLSGKTLSLLGVGRLGGKTAKIAKLFGMRVLGWSPNLTKERAEAAGVELAESKEDLFKQADFLSIHLVLAPSTRHLVGKAELAALKPTAFFFNTSRGPIVDEEALLDTLYNKRIAGAGLDVYDIEPLPLNHPLRKAPNVVLTPHNAYISDDNYKAWWSGTAQNVSNYLEGKELRAILNGKE
ncbi:hypothetical protein Clacol_003058 [Clathrus columnatus]|uniref:D-isomer specific 2-hydroxyacid dehydrogenase NAD-binding domain-containing protein n=1 Tax=Clathrus columnatus TaxID=1419009 RepID=A0AAV5A6G7_9AGAM|nr:hypothetical protein Clacol_003058 [Clathrus columnatus]